MSRDFDVVVIGGGVAGSVVASLLLSDRLCASGKVALVADRLTTGGAAAADWDARVFALSRASERILRDAGVWQHLPSNRVFAYERMCVWDAVGSPDGRGSLSFDCADIGEPNLGHIVDGRELQLQAQRAARDAGVVLIEAAVRDITIADDGARIRLGDGRELRSTLIVAADGSESPTRRLLGMATAFVEATLAQIFKVRQPDGTFRGGPAYYIERGLGSRAWGLVFAVLLIFTFGIAFNGVQANTIADVLSGAHTVPVHLTGVVLVVLAAPVFFGGMRRIARVAEIVLPLMAISYILLGVAILLMNIGAVPHAIALIVQSAFGLGPVVGGVAGGVSAALLNGVKRGLFSNEAGMGSAPNTAATATVAHPAMQGFVQAAGVFVDTMVICTMTAVIVLVSGIYDGGQNGGVTGAALTQASVVQNFQGLEGLSYSKGPRTHSLRFDYLRT